MTTAEPINFTALPEAVAIKLAEPADFGIDNNTRLYWLVAEGELTDCFSQLSKLAALTATTLEATAQQAAFTGKQGQRLSLAIGTDSAKVRYLTLVGVGKRLKALASPQSCQLMGAGIGRQLTGPSKKTVSKIGIKLLDNLTAKDTYACILGLQLSIDDNWKWRGTQTTKQYRPQEITIYLEHSDQPPGTGQSNGENIISSKILPQLHAISCGTLWARTLGNYPGNLLNPESFYQLTRLLEPFGIAVSVLSEPELKQLGMEAMLGVAQGSSNGARLVILHWEGQPDSKPIALVGKGVTFDSGGISLKNALKMEEMKFDMSGAAVVCGTMLALAKQQSPSQIYGVLGLVENMPDGKAQRPGDIVKSAAGKTIEIINTDAEGRLVLADALWYAINQLKVDLVIDLATLTGAAIVALGHHHAALFSNDQQLADDLRTAGITMGQLLWQMPLSEAYAKQLKSPYADIKNIGGMPAGTITAAQFLKHFVAGSSWAHIDIAGVAWQNKATAIGPTGATGFGVAMLNQFIANHLTKKGK